MTQFIEPVPLKRIESLVELELRILRDLVEPEGCQYRIDEGVQCYFLTPHDGLDEFSCKGFNPGGDLHG